MEGYCVLLEPGQPEAAAGAAKALSGFLKIPLFDAARQVNICRGFLLEKASREDALRFAESLWALKIRAKVLRESDVPLLPEPAAMKRAAFGAESFSYFTQAREQSLAAPWSGFRLLAAAVLNKESITTKIEERGPSVGEQAARLGLMAAGIPVGFAKKKKVEVEKRETELIFYLDIYLDPPARLRVDPLAFGFDCLGEQMTYSSTTNFRLFLLKLSERAPAALKNQGAAFIAAGKPLSTLNYASPADVDRESRWLLAV